MKKILLLMLFVFSVGCSAQKQHNKSTTVTITQKKTSRKKGYQLVLKEVVNDSRCPQGVTCVWAGQVSAVVSVYKDSELVEDATLVFSTKNSRENIEWFTKYLPADKRKIKDIAVFPYPIEGSKINPGDYYLKVEYLK